MASSDYTIWVQFFKNATIAPQFANLYATKFIENRIRFDMLADLNKELLNEMGINAVGDCLCILKHTKAINQQIEESKKELILSETCASSTNKKRCDVAKRMIETYLGSDPEVKPLSIEKTASSSTLSADLMSRLNFAASSTTQIKQQPPSAVVVKFNEDSLTHQSKVSSTTTDDDLDGLSNNNNNHRKMLNLKRKLNHQEPVDSMPEDEYDEDTVSSLGKPLEYRGLLKTQNNFTISISNNSSTTRTLAESTKPSIKSRLSKVPHNNEESKGKIIRLNKSLPPSLNESIQSGLNNIKAEMLTPPTPPHAKTSVFKRIKTSSEVESLKIRADAGHSPVNPGRAAVRLLGQGDLAVRKSPSTKIISLVKKPAQASITPISFDFPKREEASLASKSLPQATPNKTVLNRLRFPK